MNKLYVAFEQCMADVGNVAGTTFKYLIHMLGKEVTLLTNVRECFGCVCGGS